VSIVEKVSKVIGTKVKARQRRPWNSSELDCSWTTEGTWTKYDKHLLQPTNW